MARVAVSLQAGCLLALLACAACVATAADSDAGKKQQSTATASAQQYGGKEHSYHHSDGHYDKKPVAHTLYLQETSQRIVVLPNVNATQYTFRCAKDSLDAADSCLHPTHYGYGEYREYDSDNFLSDLTTTSNVAECLAATVPGACPAFIPQDLCVRFQINCTVTNQAEACGCPYADGFKFSSNGFVFLADANSCEPEYEPVYLPRTGVLPEGRRRLHAASHGYREHRNVTIYNGSALVLTTSIGYVQTNGGYQEVKGKLDFLLDFFPKTGSRSRTTERIRAAKAALQKTTEAQTAYSHYDEDSDDEGRSYHENDTPYYGHEDRYYEGAHRSYGGHGGGDYSRPPKNLVKGGNLKITLLEKQYY